MEEKQQVTSKRQVKLLAAVKAIADISENALATTSPNSQTINHRDQDDHHIDYTQVEHSKDFFENEMGAYHMSDEVSDASVVR